MNNWLPAHIAADGADVGPFTMGYYEQNDIPFQFALANAFRSAATIFARSSARPTPTDTCG